MIDVRFAVAAVSAGLVFAAPATATPSFAVDTPVPLRFTGDVGVVEALGVPDAVSACGTRWDRKHSVRSSGGWSYTVAVPPGGRGTITGVDSILRPPWPGEEALGVDFRVTLPGLQPFVLGARNLRCGGPRGVELRARSVATRLARRGSRRCPCATAWSRRTGGRDSPARTRSTRSSAPAGRRSPTTPWSAA